MYSSKPHRLFVGKISGFIRYVLLAFVSVFVATANVGCSDKSKVLDADNIRYIRDQIELQQVQYNLESFSPINPNIGLKFAIKQAAKWEPKASLIAVFETATLVSDQGGLVPLLWTYRFKNDSGTAWLGVVYGSTGVVDVMQRLMGNDALKEWPSIQGRLSKIAWNKVDSRQTFLMGIQHDAAVITVWVDDSQRMSGYTVVSDAETGVVVDHEFFLNQLRKRRSFFDNRMVGTGQEDPNENKELRFYPTGSRIMVSHW